MEQRCTLYTIPVVVHVLHEYGSELVSDSTIYTLIAGMNSFFLKTNPDTANIFLTGSSPSLPTLRLLLNLLPLTRTANRQKALSTFSPTLLLQTKVILINQRSINGRKRNI